MSGIWALSREKMKKDYSYGVIPLKKEKDRWVCFLIQHRNGRYWGFPKGHAEGKETPQETASRELTEETNLKVQHWIPIGPFEEQYQFKYQEQLIDKTVFYFVAMVSSEVKIQSDEIIAGKWVEIEQVGQFLSYASTQVTFSQVLHQIQSKKVGGSI